MADLEYLFWSLPFLAVASLIATGRASSTTVGFVGFATSLAIAMIAAPAHFEWPEAIAAMARGGWLALLVGAVILGGLFFREVTSADDTVGDCVAIPAAQRRKRLYTTCFLIGPFAESATGFGVGQVTVAPILKGIGLAPIHAVMFGLFSQMMVSWGAMANGTIVGSQLSGLSPTDLGVHSALLTVPLLFGWLCLFWRFAAAAQVAGTMLDFISEAIWTTAAAGLLIAANAMFGPEVAGLAALGPLIVARFLMDEKPDRDRWKSAIRVGLPYAALIGCLAATRAITPINEFLGHAVAVRPFTDGPNWLPLLHPSSWLLAIGLATTLAMGRPVLAAIALRHAWSKGRKPILTIAFFLAMAQVMATSGVADGLAKGLRSVLGPLAVLATPLFAGLFGFLTGSSNATNGLLMPAQIALARDAALSLPWLGAIQNVTAAALTMLSPVRVAVGCAMVGRPDLERAVYVKAWPLGVIPLAILTAAAALLLIR